MYKTDHIVAYDQQVIAELKAKQAYIDESGQAAKLRICDVRTWRVLMPWTGTKRWDGSAERFTFAEFVTDQGLTAIAEGSPDDAGLKERVLGKNPFDPQIRADLGLAYWDFVGKLAGKPLYRYLRELFDLDTPVVTQIPIAAYTWARFTDLQGNHEVTFDSYPQHMKTLVDNEGFRILKLSMCDFEPHRYIELIHNIRRAVGPDVELRVDEKHLLHQRHIEAIRASHITNLGRRRDRMGWLR